MIRTTVLPILNEINLTEELKTFNSIVRYSYNRFREGMCEKEVRALCSNFFGEKNQAWFIQCALKEGKAVYTKNQDKKVIFGGKHNFSRYLEDKEKVKKTESKGYHFKNPFTKEKLVEKRNHRITIQGEAPQKGNRNFEFHFEENLIIYKKNRKEHFEFHLPPLRKNLKSKLLQLQELANNCEMPVTVSFNEKNVWITYDEEKLNYEIYQNLKSNRVLGIDLNPNYIGLSIIQFDGNDEFQILHKEVFDLTELNEKTGKASSSKESKYLNHKRQYENIEICHKISSLMNTWKCSKLVVEELSIPSSNKGQGKTFNRLCNNVWLRNLVIDKLRVLAGIHGFELIEVNPVYSSFIGNLKYGNSHTPDMVASSIEIARRGYKKYEKDWFYPRLDLESLDERWKQTLTGVKTWKEAYDKVKESELRYRFQIGDYVSNAVFRKFHKKALVHLYAF